MATLRSLRNELFKYRRRKRGAVDGSIPGLPSERFHKSRRYVSGMPYIPRQGGSHHDLYNWGQPSQYHPNIHAPAAQSDEYVTDPDWDSHHVPHSHEPHLFRPFPELEPGEPAFDYEKAKATSEFFLKAMEVQYQPFEEGQEVPSLADIWMEHFADDQQDMPGMDIPEPAMPTELAELTGEDLTRRFINITGALSHLQTVLPEDHPDIVALRGAFHDMLEDPEAMSKLESMVGDIPSSNLGDGDPYENDTVEEAAYATEQSLGMPEDAFEQPVFAQAEHQGLDNGLGIEPITEADPFEQEAQFMDESTLEQIVEQEDAFGPAPVETMDYGMPPQELSMPESDPMAELQGYDAMSPADQINQAIDQAMEQPGFPEPEPDPWQMQYDPFSTAQQMFDEQMQHMANPFMMPGMGPMGPMSGPAPM